MNQYEMKQRAYQSNLKSRALQVLLYLIDRSNKEQTCFPAVPTIGKELHISISTVKRAMKELVDAGYVTKERRCIFQNKRNVVIWIKQYQRQKRIKLLQKNMRKIHRK